MGWFPFGRGKAGALAENIAAEYLKLVGMEILARNFRFKRKEIDIVAGSGRAIVFVEVKMRKNAYFGSPSLAVDEKKLSDIAFAARGFLGRLRRTCEEVRFDIVSIHFEEGQRRMVLEHFTGLEPPAWFSHL